MASPARPRSALRGSGAPRGARGRSRRHHARCFRNALTGRGGPGVDSHVIPRARLEDRAWRDRSPLSACYPLTGRTGEGLASRAASLPLGGGQAHAAPSLAVQARARAAVSAGLLHR
jgi:hypothetical protein